jgi:ATP-dependent DNA helicase RecG
VSGVITGTPVRLDEPLAKHFTPTDTRKLAKQLDLHTVGDLLRHFPRRYQHPSELTRLADLPVGETVTIIAEVVKASTRPMRKRRGRLLELVVTDGETTLNVTFFKPHGHEGRLVQGARAWFTGTVSIYQGRLQLTHPNYRPLLTEAQEQDARDHIDAPLPVYPAAAKLDSWAVERCMTMLLSAMGDVPDPIPAEIRSRHGLISAREAFFKIHRPASDEDWRRARYRFRFEEAFVLQVALARRRSETAALPATPRRSGAGGLLEAFDARLPFALTAGQQEVGADLAADLARPHPMHRLLQGEVGSGKTVVALRAMLAVIDSGGQAALLAPTEVLALQHHRSISAMLGDLAAAGMLGGDERGTRVALLTGSLPTAARRRSLLEIASGEAGVVIGTHALLQENVEFFDLGLVVVDEQHRFGVEQRDALRDKGRVVPHLLVMTATPIPRTVAMTVFGDLDVSTLAELPAGRGPISTHVVPAGERPAWLQRAWGRLREEVDAGHQGYVVCPKIGDGTGDGTDDDTDDGIDDGLAEDDGEDAGLDLPVSPVAGREGLARRPSRGVLEVLAELVERPEMSGLRIEALHGRLPAEERDVVMRGFAAGEIDVLVATTVVEVGVDVANATAMVVLDADRFGVSQLHQLRGRVGRGSAAGICLLVTQAEPGSPARERLDAVAATLDGFQLARVDLEQRREGDVLGAQQSGRRSSLRLLRVLRDEALIETARHEAVAVVAADPALSGQPALAAAITDLLDPEREAYLDRG